MKVAFYTLGCKVNQYETEAMETLFKQNNYKIVSYEDVSDVYVINTCTVTNMSDRKSRQMIRRAEKQNPNAIVAVVGCYAQTNPADILEMNNVDVVIGSNRKNEIVTLVEKARTESRVINAVDDIMSEKVFEETPIEESSDRTRAYLKIQEGCQQFCAYCIIPYARGPIRSRTPENVYNEVARLVNNGFKEIVLTGIHVASYGKDMKEDTWDLVKLIEFIHGIDGLERIRLSSMEPTYLTKERIIALSKLAKLCNHYHLSLQSGCDETLKRMNRKYTTNEYEAVVLNLRKYIKNVAITTDVIVGFPQETEDEFNKTYEFLQKINLTKLHVFKFSPRKGTKAAKMEGQISEITKNERSQKLINLSAESLNSFYKQFIGEKLEVLVEQAVKDNEDIKDVEVGIDKKREKYVLVEPLTKATIMEGHTKNYVKVIFEGESNLKGELINIEIKSLGQECLIGGF